MNIESLSSLGEIRVLLAGNDLPVADLSEESLPHFFGLRSEGSLVGVVGLEIHHSQGLLRSLAIQPTFRGQGYARDLVRFVEGFCVARGLDSLFLLTTTAAAFFAKLGYQPAARRDAPEEIRATSQFSTLCPASSSFMMKNLTANSRIK